MFRERGWAGRTAKVQTIGAKIGEPVEAKAARSAPGAATCMRFV